MALIPTVEVPVIPQVPAQERELVQVAADLRAKAKLEVTSQNCGNS